MGISLNKKQLELLILEKLQLRIGERYKLDKTNLQFIYDNEKYTNIFNLTFYKRTLGYAVEPNIWIQIKAIENIYHEICSREKKYFKDTITIGSSCGNLIENTDGEFKQNNSLTFPIENDEDIEGVTEQIFSIFSDIALPYFNKYSNLNIVDSIYNDKPEIRTVHKILNPERCTKGLIAAYLVKNPKYLELESVYVNKMENVSGPLKDEFNNCRKLLNGLRIL